MNVYELIYYKFSLGLRSVSWRETACQYRQLRRKDIFSLYSYVVLASLPSHFLAITRFLSVSLPLSNQPEKKKTFVS